MDVNCPYCNAENEICHDDGYGYAEDETFGQECHACRKTFAYTTYTHHSYTVKQAPCMNGEPHELEPSCIHPPIFKNPRHCKHCDWTDREIDPEKYREFFERAPAKV